MVRLEVRREKLKKLTAQTVSLVFISLQSPPAVIDLFKCHMQGGAMGREWGAGGRG